VHLFPDSVNYTSDRTVYWIPLTYCNSRNYPIQAAVFPLYIFKSKYFLSVFCAYEIKVLVSEQETR